MIQTVGVSKKFDDVQAVNSLSLEIHQGEVFGLVGTNGAGKSTLLRMLCGILKQDEGTITVDGRPVYEDEETKREIFYISDDSYFFSNGTPVDMERYYRQAYDLFSKAFTQEDFPICGMDQHTFDYLLAVLSYHFKEYDVAVKFCGSIVQAKGISAKLKDKALMLKDEIMAAKKAEEEGKE